MKIEKNKVASIDYTLTNPQGEVLDSSKGREPLAYLHGTGGLIPGLEKALEGKSAGESLSVTIAPAEAYGELDAALLQKVSRRMFGGTKDLRAGMQFQAQTEAGPRTMTIVGFEGGDVRVDGNHPLAGVTLHFEVKIVAVRDALPEEIEHGHVHGAGGHHHH
jgi:FKBP-type peptidyl-prolyl cis-trans isomerase SlyD